jgi:hypothetical protein
VAIEDAVSAFSGLESDVKLDTRLIGKQSAGDEGSRQTGVERTGRAREDAAGTGGGTLGSLDIRWLEKPGPPEQFGGNFLDRAAAYLPGFPCDRQRQRE